MAAPPELLSGCKSCQDIWRRFTDPTFKDAVSFGPPAAALSTPCPIHRPLVESFVKVLRSENTGIYRATAAMSIRKPGKEASPRLVESYSGGVFWDLLLARPDDKPDHPGTTRVLEPDWADLDMLKRWKDECLSSHGAKCESLIHVFPSRPAWLIDVERKCLVPGSAAEAAPYVALSYTYGEYVAPGIDAETLVALQQANALGLPETSSEYVPPMVQHAMGLTSVLGERYLWADLLCVPDGDPTLAKEEHLQQMGAVYANAVVTIIGADGDVEKGLPGLRGISGPRNLHQRVIPFGEENKLVVRRPQVYRFDGHLSTELPYYRRAWTFQERLLSPRKIYFHEKELHWECARHVLHEEQVQPAAEVKMEEPTDYPDMSAMLAGFPDLGALDAVVDRYNARDLRYDEDALPAISGLLTVLSRAFTGGFLYGIPEMFFERGLGWRHGPSLRTKVRRRSPSRRPDRQGRSFSSSVSDLPSWSWIGWQGRVTMGRDGEAARINNRSHEIEETVPITKWYTARSPDAGPSQRREINSTWFEDREKYKDFSKPLPPGWTRHEAPGLDHFGRPRPYPDGCADYVFRHDAMPAPTPETRQSDSWYYPFTVPEVGTPGTMPNQTPYLFCETTRVWLWGCQADRMNQVELYDSLGCEAGELYLPNRSDLGAFPRRGLGDGHDGQEERGLRVELVAIYKSRVCEFSLDQETRVIGAPVRRSERYTVLWVEWKEGVAYRLASGYVRAESWDKLEHEQVSLVLN
ncbi:HET-domain-containing protein [Apiospora aurea]|uniref:HET-domain-containing protein n=1 Tax=Apiospora aurea TaxID=335848 RepID=A0ABR1PT84_9PEZI